MHNPSTETSSSFANGVIVPTKLNNIRTMIRVPKNRRPVSLPRDYEPSSFDVCCGRGKKHWNLPGNMAFRMLVQSRLQSYIDADTKSKKTAIVIALVDEVKQQGGHFLKMDKFGRWYDIGDDQARDKVGHSLRDHVTRLNREKKQKQQKKDKKEKASIKKVKEEPQKFPTLDQARFNDVSDAVAGLTSLQQPSALEMVLRRSSSLFRSSLGSLQSIEFGKDDNDTESSSAHEEKPATLEKELKGERYVAEDPAFPYSFAASHHRGLSNIGQELYDFDISLDFKQKASI